MANKEKLPELYDIGALSESIEMKCVSCMKMAEKGKHDEALKCLSEMETSFKSAHAQAALFKGLVLMDFGKFDEAKSMLQDAMKFNPSSAFPYLALAACEYKLGHKGNMLPLLKKAIELAPNDVNVLTMASVAYYSIDRVKEGDECMKKATELSPHAAYASLELGIKKLLEDPSMDSETKKRLKGVMNKNKKLVESITALRNLKRKK
ncbi:MAG: hypothetical protein QW112_01905 [Candidatus Micrarchaeia archaeon]